MRLSHATGSRTHTSYAAHSPTETTLQEELPGQAHAFMEAKGSRTSRVASGTVTGVLQLGVQIGMQVLLAPIVLKLAGRETLGAYAVVMQAITYLSLVDLGFGIAINRYLSQSTIGEGWKQRFGSVFAIGRTYFLFSNCLFSILVIFLALNIGNLIDLSGPVALDARRGLLALAVWALIRVAFVVYGAALNATQHIAAANLTSLAGTVGRLVGSVALLWLGFGLTALIAANILGEALTFALQRRQFRRYFPDLSLTWGIRDWPLFREMIGFGGSTLLLTIGARLTFSTDGLIVGTLFGAAVASIYYTTQMPAFLAFSVIFRLIASAEPAINELLARCRSDSLRAAYIRLHRYTLMISVCAAIGFAMLGRPLITHWVGERQFAGNLVLLSAAFFIVLVTFANIDYTFLIAMGKVKTLSWYALAEGLGNVALSIVLGRLIGFEGVMLASVIAMSPRTIYQSRTARHNFQMSLSEFASSLIGPLVLPTVIGTGILWIAKSLLGTQSWLALGTVSFLFVATFGATALIWSLTPQERASVIRALPMHSGIGI